MDPVMAYKDTEIIYIQRAFLFRAPADLALCRKDSSKVLLSIEYPV